MHCVIFFLENKTYSSVRTEALSVIELLLKKLEGEFLIVLIGGPDTLWHSLEIFYSLFNKHVL